MPKPIVDKLVKAIEIGGKDPEYVKYLTSTNNFPTYLGPGELFKFFEEERRTHRSIFEKAGLLKEK